MELRSPNGTKNGQKQKARPHTEDGRTRGATSIGLNNQTHSLTQSGDWQSHQFAFHRNNGRTRSRLLGGVRRSGDSSGEITCRSAPCPASTNSDSLGRMRRPFWLHQCHLSIAEMVSWVGQKSHSAQGRSSGI